MLPSVILHHPINRNNFENVNDMVDLAYQAGCNALTFSPLKCWWGSLGSVSLSQDGGKPIVSLPHTDGREIGFFLFKT